METNKYRNVGGDLNIVKGLTRQQKIELIIDMVSGIDLSKKYETDHDFSEVTDRELGELERILEIVEKPDGPRTWNTLSQEDKELYSSISKKIKVIGSLRLRQGI